MTPAVSADIPEGLTTHLRQHSRRRLAALILLVLFALLFVGVLVVANRGDGRHYWGGITHIPHWDKLGHFGLLAVFSLLLNLTLGLRRMPGRVSGLLLGSALLYAGMTLEEFSQLFITTRTFDVFDWLSSLVGIAAGGWLACRLAAPGPRDLPRAG